MTARNALPRFYSEEDDAFDMPTTPPPAGGQDPFAAATRVGPIPPSLLAELMSSDTARSDAAAAAVAASLRPAPPSGIQLKKKAEMTTALDEADLFEIYDEEDGDLLELTSCVPVQMQLVVGVATAQPVPALDSAATTASSAPRGLGSTLRLVVTMLPPAAVAPHGSALRRQPPVSTLGKAHIAAMAVMLAAGFAPIAYFLLS